MWVCITLSNISKATGFRHQKSSLNVRRPKKTVVKKKVVRTPKITTYSFLTVQQFFKVQLCRHVTSFSFAEGSGSNSSWSHRFERVSMTTIGLQFVPTFLVLQLEMQIFNACWERLAKGLEKSKNLHFPYSTRRRLTQGTTCNQHILFFRLFDFFFAIETGKAIVSSS